MSSPKPKKVVRRWEQFEAFIQGSDYPDQYLLSLERELEAAGIDVERVNLAVSDIVATGRSRAAEGWLARARKAQADFERTVRRKRAWISDQFGSARELVRAISSGQLGAGVQKQAFVFFRNQDLASASESDLRSFVNDCELLGILENPKRRGPKS